MNYQTCSVYDCCGGTIIRDNGMRAKCRTCDGRGVVEAPRVTASREPMAIHGARGTDVHDYAPAKGAAMPDYVHGIREGERRMLWLVVLGAEWSHAFRISIASHAQTQRTALDVLSASGDEDASRVLGERGL